MHAPFRTCLPLALLALAACSSKTDQQAATASSAKPAADSPVAKANAEFARLQAQGPTRPRASSRKSNIRRRAA